MGFGQQLKEVYFDAVRLREELALIPTKHNLDRDIPEKGHADAPQDGVASGAAVFQLGKLRRGIRTLQDALYREWRQLPPGASAEYQRQLFFIHMLVDHLDRTMKPLGDHLRQVETDCGPEVVNQIREGNAELDWHISQLSPHFRFEIADWGSANSSRST